MGREAVFVPIYNSTDNRSPYLRGRTYLIMVFRDVWPSRKHGCTKRVGWMSGGGLLYGGSFGYF